MVNHEISKPSYEAAQSGILSSDIFLSIEGKPVDVGTAPLETRKYNVEPVPSEVANIPFKAVKHPDDIDPEATILRNKHNAVSEARRITFTNMFSAFIDYGKTREQSKPSHEKHNIFVSHN